MTFPYLLVLAVCFFIPSRSVAQTKDSTDQRKAPTSEEIEKIIRTFATKETDFYEAWKQYTYRQVTEVRIVAVNGFRQNERMTLTSEVVFNDDGTREVKLVHKSGELRSVLWTREDAEVITNLQPFALTIKDLPLYNLKYENREKVDELECYVFSVKPRSTKGGKLYFQGKIWVDDQDLQIVRTVGKPVPQRRESQFPAFETIRQIIDDQYWFPVWTHADDILDFDRQKVRIEETINYQNYRKFGSKATIEFIPPKP